MDTSEFYSTSTEANKAWIIALIVITAVTVVDSFLTQRKIKHANRWDSKLWQSSDGWVCTRTILWNGINLHLKEVSTVNKSVPAASCVVYLWYLCESSFQSADTPAPSGFLSVSWRCKSPPAVLDGAEATAFQRKQRKRTDFCYLSVKCAFLWGFFFLPAEAYTSFYQIKSRSST